MPGPLLHSLVLPFVLGVALDAGAGPSQSCGRDSAETECRPGVASFSARTETPGPRCPKGFEPSFGEGPGRRFRCVAAPRPVEKPAPQAPAASSAPEDGAAKGRGCPPGTRRLKTENPFEPVRCIAASEASPPVLKPDRYRSYEVPGELRLDYPADWHLTDAWKDDVPSLYIQLDTRRDGKPVTLTVSRFRAKRRGYQDIETMMRQESEWHGAKEGGKGAVGGLPARFLEVPNQTRLAYLRTADGHIVIGYSAPEEFFRSYAPAYARLLKTFHVVHDEQDPHPEAAE
ncbi:MAG: hypothetical protein HY554_10245 [Elusimicrobia bacterium]|nr:hypothetical protein [Elusimicrobiota bacterium]